MKKNFMKKLATSVALALTVTTIVPGSGAAQAAGTQSLSANAVTLYKGSSYDFNVKNSSSAYTYTYTSADKGVATVSSKSGLVSAKSNGATKISCKIVNKKTKKAVKTLSATVTIVDKMAANTKAITLNEQETFDINMNKAITSVYSYRYSTSDASVATITSTTGIVTGVKEGTATVTVTVTNKSTKKSNKITIPVTIKAGKVRVVKAEQTHRNKVVLTLAGPDEELKTKPAVDDVVIKDSLGIPNYVKEIAYDAAKKTATVTTYTDFSNDTKYTVTYKETSADFTAKLGDAAKVLLENQTVKYSTPTKLKIKVLDANGIDITSDDELKKISIDMDTDKGYINDDGATKEITIYNIGDKATVTATYNTGKYSDTGVETTFESNKVVVNAVEKLANVVNFVAYSAEKGATKPDWEKVNHIIPLESTDYKLKVKVTNADGDEITDAPEFESKDDNVLTVDNNGVLYPQKSGTAYIKVTVNEVSQVLSITVGKETVLNSVTVDTNSITVSNVSDANDIQVVKVTARDQFGNDITERTTIVPSDVDGITATAIGNDGTFAIKTSNEKGTASLKFTADLNGGSKRVATVSVKSVTSTKDEIKTYKPVYTNKGSIDIGEGQNIVNVRVDGLDSSGVKIKSVVIKEIQLKAPNGQNYVIATSGTAVGATDTVTGASLISSTLAVDTNVNYIPVVFGTENKEEISPMLGTYGVTFVVVDKDGKDKTVKAPSITVKNSTAAKPSITVEKKGTETFELSKGAVDAKALGGRFFSAKIDGNSVNVALNDYNVTKGNLTEAGEATIVVKSLSLDDGNVLFAYNRTINVKIK